MPTPFKRAALIKQLADDNSLAIWYWHKHHKAWFSGIPVMLFDSDETLILALGEKPTQPPPKMCVLAGVEFPAPETAVPEVGTPVYYASLTRDWSNTRHFSNWTGTSFGEDLLLKLGLVHLTHEAAEQHSRALLAANKQAVEEAR